MSDEMVSIPKRWVDEVISALDAATVINERTLRTGKVEALHNGNHHRLIIEAAENGWSLYAEMAAIRTSGGYSQ